MSKHAKPGDVSAPTQAEFLSYVRTRNETVEGRDLTEAGATSFSTLMKLMIARDSHRYCDEPETCGFNDEFSRLLKQTVAKITLTMMALAELEGIDLSEELALTFLEMRASE